MQRARVTLHYASGDSASLTVVDGGLVEPARTALPVPAGTRWSPSASDSVAMSGTMVAFVLSREVARRPASEIRRIAVQGSLRRMLVRDTLSAPWTAGDVYRADGRRLHLFDTVDVGQVGWRLRWSEPRNMAEAERERYGDWPDDLVNTSLVRIDREGVAHAIARQNVQHTKNPFVLMWTVRNEETLWLGVDGAELPADVAGSRLHVVRWKTAAVVPVRAEYRMPEKGPETH
jgi:hypothetical protein